MDFQALELFFCYKINQLIFSDYKYKKVIITVATVVSIAGCANLTQFGTRFNENIISVIVIAAIYFLLKYLRFNTVYYLILSGVLLGAAIGFKLTFVTYVFAVVLTFCFLNFRNYKIIFIFLISISFGFLAVNGIWMYKMYELFGNPLYPIFSDFLNHKYAIGFSRDTYFLPKNLWEWIFLPFYFFNESHQTCELSFRDFRLGVIYILIFIFLIQNIIYRIKLKKNIIKRSELFLLGVFILSYLLWLLIFSIQRYTIPLEFLSGTVMCILLYKFFPDRIKIIFLLTTVLLSVVIFQTTIYADYGRISFEKPFNTIDSKINIRKSLIIFYDMPTAYLAPSLGDSNVYIDSPDYFWTSKYALLKKEKLISEYQNSLYIVLLDKNRKLSKWFKDHKYYIDAKTCIPVGTQDGAVICRLKHE